MTLNFKASKPSKNLNIGSLKDESRRNEFSYGLHGFTDFSEKIKIQLSRDSSIRKSAQSVVNNPGIFRMTPRNPHFSLCLTPLFQLSTSTTLFRLNG
jgi:hypothetical protein